MTLVQVCLFVLTAFMEIAGCYLLYTWVRYDYTAWVLLPSVIALGLFAWLLTLQPFATGRIYAEYGAIYVTIAVFWLWWVDDIVPTTWDIVGVVITLIGMAIIGLAPR